MVDIDSLRRDWVGKEFHRAEYTIGQQQVLDYAASCGDTDPRYSDPSNPDFEAHPTFIGCLGNTRDAMTPQDFPGLGRGRSIDGGKSVEIHGPIRPGDRLSARSEIADIYAKTGRSGTMLFIVHRLNFFNQNEEPVATVDLRQIKAVED